MSKPVSFYSEGVKLAGDLFLPADVKQGDRRAGIVLCHGYTGVRSIYLPDNARVLAEAGYVVMSFDYKGWGDSEGPKSRLAPYSRVADVQAALTFLGAQPEVDAARLGIYGTSYGGATVVFVAAVDPRVKCVVSVVGVGNGARWMRGRGPRQARPDWRIRSSRPERGPAARPAVGRIGCGSAARQSGGRDTAAARIRRRHARLQSGMDRRSHRAAAGFVHHDGR
jgi:predicted acyl esterase